MDVQREIQVEVIPFMSRRRLIIFRLQETGPDFVIRTMEECLTGSRYCDLSFVCEDRLAVAAHCSVVSAVSSFLRDLLKEVYLGGRESVIIYLCDVEMQDMQHFLVDIRTLPHVA